MTSISCDRCGKRIRGEYVVAGNHWYHEACYDAIKDTVPSGWKVYGSDGGGWYAEHAATSFTRRYATRAAAVTGAIGWAKSMGKGFIASGKRRARPTPAKRTQRLAAQVDALLKG